MTTAVVAFLVASMLVSSQDLPLPAGGMSGACGKGAVIDVVSSEPSLCLWTIFSFAALTLLIINRTEPQWSLRLFELFAMLEGFWLGLICARVGPSDAGAIVWAIALALYIFVTLTLVTLGL